MLENTPISQLMKNIHTLTDDEIPHDEVSKGFQGHHHTAFIRENMPFNAAPVCGLYMTAHSNDGESVDYKYIDQLELHEIEKLIPLLEVARRKIVELTAKMKS